MNRRLRTALAVTSVVSAGLLMTACEGGDASSAPAATSPGVTASSGSSAASDQASPTASSDGEGGDKSSASSGSGTSKTDGDDTSADSGADSGTDNSADKSGYGQSCGTNDISWSVSSESQAGGYFLIKAKAKSGITCILPAALPVVAFGSDGTEAGPAEQSVGEAITLRAGVTAYAGVAAKSTKGNGGKELDFLIVSVSDDDPNPESLNVGTFVVDEPIVTNWHTSAADAVPFTS